MRHLDPYKAQSAVGAGIAVGAVLAFAGVSLAAVTAVGVVTFALGLFRLWRAGR